MSSPPATTSQPMSLPVRAAMWGATAAGLAGAAAGLVVGLLAYAPTAWFAVIEVGLPAAIAGGLVGLVVGSITLALRRRARPPRGARL